MSAEPFASWDEKHRAASRIVDGADGWARGMDTSDDDAVLAWARHYLPRVVAHGQRDVS